MIVPILILAGVSFFISWAVTFQMIRVAPKIGLVDDPGHRKIHQDAKPLGGGIAIFAAIALPMLAGLLFVNTVTIANSPYLSGVVKQTPAALMLLGAMFLMHLVGLWDDRRALGPFTKLILQLAITTALVLGIKDLRILTAVGEAPSIILTVLWIVAVTNAFNFLDNMDGLCAGVAAVCTAAFLITALMIGQYFVAATLALLLGAVLGFLFWNFPPASIFMGDSGSLVIGLLLGVLTVRTTFLPHGTEWGAGWYAVFAPLIVLAVPLYDMITVVLLRLRRRQSPFVGDTNHFSHRLVARGMSRRTAVLCIYLVTAATSMAAILLPHVNSTFGAMLIFGQTLLVLGVVALLEQHPLPTSAPSTGTPGEGWGEGSDGATRPASCVEDRSTSLEAPLEASPQPDPLPGYRERG
jgi:UDP-GlcNAc:undecaprenyl-phosphate GlcNAc-1-phosphate transferase